MAAPVNCFLQRLVIFGLLMGLCIDAQAVEPTSSRALDLLVIAPHSDDEAIGCTGVILRAIAVKKRPGVVILTAGDGFPKAAAAAAKKPVEQLQAADYIALAELRQRHSIEAMRRLGVRADDLLFLGYPDGGMAAMYEAKNDTPYRQPFTGHTSTYGPVFSDYHRAVHGHPAPYLRASAVDDLAEIIRTRRPSEIYVTGEADTHPDHRFAFRYVRDAAQASQYRGVIWTYVVHGEPPAAAPELVLKLDDHEIKLKRSLLESYEVGVSPVHDGLAEEYTKPEERFWRARLSSDTQ